RAEPPETLDDQAPLGVESAWGAAAAFCLWQAFGSVVANAFIFFWTYEGEVMGDRRNPPGIGLRLAGLTWIIIFLSAESCLLAEVRRFFSARGIRAFGVLSSPLELFKLALAVLGAAAWLVCFGADPFPAPAAGPHRLLSLTFLAGAYLLSLANDRMNKKFAGKLTTPREDSLAELAVRSVFAGGFCAITIAATYVIPGGAGFYIFTLLGLGSLLLFATPILLRGTLLTRDLPRCAPLGAVADRPPP
ncbi:MAG TPA: hypothetical protein VHB99_17040, partial [Pirellulales bacterium]|nr:hypothetical protein [Pirellulales bacterium]